MDHVRLRSVDNSHILMARRLIILISAICFCLLGGPICAHAQTMPAADLQVSGDAVGQVLPSVEQDSPQQPQTVGGSFTSITKCCNECAESVAGSKVKLKCSRCIDVPKSGKCELDDKVERFIIDCKGTFLDQKTSLTCYS